MIRWLLVGYGDLADKRVASALKEAEDSELVAIWGRNPNRAKEFAERHGIKESFGGDRLLEVINRKDIDAVYVCTPVYSHFEYASLALEAGKDVLCEKPLAMNTEECDKLIDLADKKNKILGVAYYRRCYPKHKYIREIIQSGELGDGVLVVMEHYCWYSPSIDDPKHWRVVREKSGGGVSFDVGSHRLDLLLYWFGRIDVMTAEAENKAQKWEVEDTATFWLKMKDFNKANGLVCFSWSAATYIDRLEVVGSKKKIEANPLDGKELIITKGREREVKEFDLPENVHLPLVEDFVRAVKEGREPICGGKEARKVNEILEALKRS